MSVKILNIEPKTYKRHLIHGEGRDWMETNCYMDVWIELLHAKGFEPIAALACAFDIDFEGDQWTFFKYSLHDLEVLYGLNIQELNIWRDLLDCVEEQLSRKNHVLVEMDSYFLPDTVGTAYKIEHVKSTIAVNEVDRKNRRMEYFHNQGYHSVEGEDFDNLFFLVENIDARVLPPYVEYVKQLTPPCTNDGELLEASLACLRNRLKNLPSKNPFLTFKDRFYQDFSDSNSVDIEYFHKYSFATLRQSGAAFELCKTYLQWVQKVGGAKTVPENIIDAYDQLSKKSKVLQFQLARTVARKKALDLSPLDECAEYWETACKGLTDFLA